MQGQVLPGQAVQRAGPSRPCLVTGGQKENAGDKDRRQQKCSSWQFCKRLGVGRSRGNLDVLWEGRMMWGHLTLLVLLALPAPDSPRGSSDAA